jgi:hypothetical protein
MDVGPNDLQNYPEFAGSMSGPGGLTFWGFLNSEPDSDYLIQFYLNSVPDASNHGEGELYLGGTIVATDSLGNASFLAAVPPSDTLAGSWYLTATATHLGKNNTSEFAENIFVSIPPMGGGGGMGNFLTPAWGSNGSSGGNDSEGISDEPADIALESLLSPIGGTGRARFTEPEGALLFHAFRTGVCLPRIDNLFFGRWRSHLDEEAELVA